MKPIFMVSAFLVLVVILFARPSSAETVCYEREILMAFFVHEGMALHSWGLTDAGNMQELFLSDDGQWAIVETTPTHCPDVVSFPLKERGRLSEPPHNPADLRPRMTPGVPS